MIWCTGFHLDFLSNASIMPVLECHLILQFSIQYYSFKLGG